MSSPFLSIPNLRMSAAGACAHFTLTRKGRQNPQARVLGILFLSTEGSGIGIIARKGTGYFGHLRRQVQHTKRKEADSMNINILEKAARMVLKGENVDSRPMLKNGVITPAEHRSLESL